MSYCISTQALCSVTHALLWLELGGSSHSLEYVCVYYHAFDSSALISVIWVRQQSWHFQGDRVVCLMDNCGTD